MRDFRLPNVLTRTGQEGDYVVVDMEYAGPDNVSWSKVSPLTGWDQDTLTMVLILESNPVPCPYHLCFVWTYCCLTDGS